MSVLPSAGWPRRSLAPETYRLLAKTLPDLLNSEFTAEMEAVLDEIAAAIKIGSPICAVGIAITSNRH
jgi:hypothetical protein